MAHVTAAHHVRNLWRGLGQRQKHQSRIRGDYYTSAIVPLGLSAVKGCVARRGERADVHPCKQPCAGMWGIPAHSFRLKRQKKTNTNPHNHCNPNLSPQLAPTYAASTTNKMAQQRWRSDDEHKTYHCSSCYSTHSRR